jgi:hypothetical protein
MIHKYCFSGVEVRHDRGVELEDELVLQVSQFKWLVASDSGAAGRQRQKFSVKRNADVADDKDRDKEGCKVCADWNMDYGDTSSCDDGTNESYCDKSAIFARASTLAIAQMDIHSANTSTKCTP